LKEQHPSEFSQEKVAARVGVTIKTYGAWERYREPNYERRRAIAEAMYLAPDYFEAPAPDLQGLEARYSELVALVRSVDDRLERLEDRERRAESRS
jgi:transcriptional regulator with XRE-family HTH domain